MSLHFTADIVNTTNIKAFYFFGVGKRWPSGLGLGLRSKRSGVRSSLGSLCCVHQQNNYMVSKTYLLPKSTGNTQEAMAPS